MLLTINGDQIYFTQINEHEIKAYHVHDSTDAWYTVITEVEFFTDENYSEAFKHCLQINHYRNGDRLAFIANLANTNNFAKVCLIYYLEHIMASDKYSDCTGEHVVHIDKCSGKLYTLLASEALTQEIAYVEFHSGAHFNNLHKN